MLTAANMLIAFSAIAVVVAYFFRRRSRVVEVPAVAIWMRIGRPVNVRSIGGTTQGLLSLLTQLLILGLLAFALINPYKRPPVSHRLVIIIDLSATMQTRGTSGARFDQAVTVARRLLAEVPADTEVVLIGAAHHPITSPSETTDVSTAMEALAVLRPFDVESDLPAAVRGASFMASDASARLYVISDFAGEDPVTLRSFWPGPAPIEFFGVGSTVPDAAVTNVWSVPARGRTRVGAVIASRGMGGRAAAVRLVADGRAVTTRQITLGDDPVKVEFAGVLPAGTAFEIAVDSGDGLDVDNHAFGVISARRQPVVLVTNGNPPLQQALAAEQDVQLTVVSPGGFDWNLPGNIVIADASALASMPLAPATTAATTRSSTSFGFQNVPATDATAAGYLFIGTPDPFGHVALAGRVLNPRVTHWSGSHTILADVTPDAPTFRESLSLAGNTPGLRPIVYAGGQPLIAEFINPNPSPAEGAKARMIYWLFHLDRTDLSTRAGFPVLLWNTIDYLADRSVEPETLRTGKPLLRRMIKSPSQKASNSAAPVCTDPQGNALPVQQSGEWLKIIDTTRQGVYTIGGPEPLRVAANLLSDRGLEPLPTIPPTETRAEGAGSVYQVEWANWDWRRIVAVAIGLLVIEWLLFHTRALRIGN